MAIRHYVLLATDGFIDVPTTPNYKPLLRKRVYVFGFVGGLLEVDGEKIESNKYLDWKNKENWDKLLIKRGTASIPSPIIWCEVGDQLYITLINLGKKFRPDLKDYHTVHICGGQVATQLDGFPENSFGVPVWDETSSLKEPPHVTYYFQPENPGTLMYHCNVEAYKHIQMGMYGALIIYPTYKSLSKEGIVKWNGHWRSRGKYQPQIPITATNRNFAYNDINTYYDKEYVMLLSDIDSEWHQSILKNTPYNAVNFKPDFWLLNGRAFPDTLLPHPNTLSANNNKNLAQINYESYAHIKTGQKFICRMINMGYQPVPWYIHGWNFAKIGKDSHINPLLKVNSFKNQVINDEASIVLIGSGETYDLMINADDKSSKYNNYNINGQDGFDSLSKQLKNIQQFDYKAIYDIPTEPLNLSDPDLIDCIKICEQSQDDSNSKFFPQFYPMHNYSVNKLTNNGNYPGGQLTFIQIDAP